MSFDKNISPRQLRALVLGAELGSFTEAAGALHISQSAYSLLVQQLEEHLGVRVFERTTRKVSLSPAGAEFLPLARRVIADLGEIGVRSQDLQAGRRGTLRLAVVPTVACSLLPGILAALRIEMPDVRVELYEEQAVPLLAHIEQGGSELGIGVRPQRETSLQFDALFEDPLVAVLNAAHPLAQARKMRWRALRDVPFISVSSQSGIWAHALRAATAAKISLRPSLETRSFFTAIGLVRAGLGCAVLPELGMVGASLQGVAVLPLVDPVVKRSVGIIARAASELSPVAAAFIRLAKAAASAQASRGSIAVQKRLASRLAE